MIHIVFSTACAMIPGMDRSRRKARPFIRYGPTYTSETTQSQEQAGVHTILIFNF